MPTGVYRKTALKLWEIVFTFSSLEDLSIVL